MHAQDKIQFTVNNCIYLYSLIVTQNINYETIT